MFALPLQHRMGSGYIFSTKFTPKEKVLEEHLNYWKKSLAYLKIKNRIMKLL